AQNELTSNDVSCSKGFRYVRYIGPNDVKCNLSELEFYGYQGEGNNSQLSQITNLASVIIHTKNAEDIVSRDYYLKGIVSVISENGTNIYTDSLEIKGRGNASWSFPKKPYRMKLYNKASLLGFPAVEKSWTLINNYGDKTLMRNLLAFDLSERLEISYTPAGKPVDVFLNGEYKGTYQLCDQMEVATGRVEVEIMSASDVTLPNLSGGYMLEMDAYAYEETSWFTSARNHIPVTIKYPKDDNIVLAQSNFIKSHFDLMESAAYSSAYTNATTGYRKYLDVPSFLRHFLVGEISGNTDTYWSTYMYKKRNNDLFYFGPVWDFDIAYENDVRTYPINSKPDWIYLSGSTANGVRDLVNRLFTDPALVNQLKSTYAYYRDNGIITKESLLGVVNDYALEMNQSQSLNFMRWDILNTIVHQNPVALGSYAAEVEHVKNYISARIDWMDNRLAYVPNADNNVFLPEVFMWSGVNTLHLEGITGEVFIRIYDLAGRVIAAKQLTDSHYSITINPGIYIVNISDKTGKSFSLKGLVS
ncbi:MAG: CotH kinase family protein, partial [Bacteroidales bacterium]|nr:CotH kinase family protein [Bacteroidales bacterium]